MPTRNKPRKPDKEDRLKLSPKDILMPLAGVGLMILYLSVLLFRAIDKDWHVVFRDLLSGSIVGLTFSVFGGIALWMLSDRIKLGNYQDRIRSGLRMVIEQSCHFLTRLSTMSPANGSAESIVPGSDNRNEDDEIINKINLCLTHIYRLQQSSIKVADLKKLRLDIENHLNFLEKAITLYQKYFDYHRYGHEMVEQAASLYKLTLSLRPDKQGRRTKKTDLGPKSTSVNSDEHLEEYLGKP